MKKDIKISANNSNVIMNCNEESLKTYLKEINKYPLLSRDEEKELFNSYNSGSSNAKNKLINSNLRFVVSVAKQYKNQGLSVQDLINEGNIGLMTALEKFDVNQNIKFISFAVWRIRQAIQSAIMDKGTNVRLPVNKYESLKKLNKIYNELEQNLSRRPTESEILNHDNSVLLKLSKSVITEYDVTEILISKKTEMSIDAPINDDSDETYTIGDTLQSYEEVEPLDNINIEINNILSNLTQLERNIIILNYGILNAPKKHDLQEIADYYSLSKERVRQIKEKAIRKLRDNPSTNKLFMYF